MFANGKTIKMRIQNNYTQTTTNKKNLKTTKK